jgi:hypothetical protein
VTESLKFEIKNTVVTATSRKLSNHWMMIWGRIDMPKDVDWKHYPYHVELNAAVTVENSQSWLEENVGALDQAWTYRDSGSILFREQSDAVQFKLSFS